MARRLFLPLLVVTFGAACGPRELRVDMSADNNSGQSGFAVLTDRGGSRMTVYVETNAPDYAADQRAHIHPGTCGEIGAIRVGLELLKPLDGNPGRYASTTQVEGFGFKDLASGEWVINVHDARDNGVYVVCGVLPRP